MFGRISSEYFRMALVMILGAVSLAAAGCESVRYYTHVAAGQVQILGRRQPISDVLAASQTDPQVKQRLRQILAVRDFARDELFLPVDDQYSTYVDLGRPYAAWNVTAAPEFSLAPKTWYYPFIGRAAYRGYFSRDLALSCAAELERQGLDVHIGGVAAYSTLGWFSDPVFSTIMRRDESAAAALVFHELAHQILYVADDTTFNESFATAVEQEGLRRWLAAEGNPSAHAAYMLRNRRQRAFLDLVEAYRERLAGLYRQKDLPASTMRRRKALLFEQMRAQYAALRLDWQGCAGYDNWFDRPLNNAKLNAVGTYHDLVPAFTRLLAQHGGNLAAFYDDCRTLAGLPKPERDRRLRPVPPVTGAESPAVSRFRRLPGSVAAACRPK
jgi:predicted aminopeptidase